MTYHTTRLGHSESQTSLIGSLQSPAYATAGHSDPDFSPMNTAGPPLSREPAILVVPASPVQSFSPSRQATACRPPSVASSISTTSTIAATEDVKDLSVDYEKPPAHSLPPHPLNAARDLESGRSAEHPSRQRLAMISAIALLVVVAVVVAVILARHPGHPGQYHVYPDKHTDRPDNARLL